MYGEDATHCDRLFPPSDVSLRVPDNTLFTQPQRWKLIHQIIETSANYDPKKMDETKHVIIVSESNLSEDLLEKLKSTLTSYAEKAGEASKIELDELCLQLDLQLRMPSNGSWSILSFSTWDTSPSRVLENIKNQSGDLLYMRAVIGDREVIVWWEAS